VAVKLAQDIADVALRGEGADHEAARDLGVTETAGDQQQDVAFTVGELRERRQWCLWVAASGKFGDQATCDLRRYERVAGGDYLDSVQQVTPRRVLRQEAAGAGA
jgi:hypothetical protein